MKKIILKQLHRERDEVLLQEILLAAPTYWMKISGELPGSQCAAENFAALPPGKTDADKFSFALVWENKFIGHIDLILGYPRPQTAMLGLLLIKESHQHQGLGKLSYEALEVWLKEHHPELSVVRLAVVLTNPQALNFWKKRGFKETGEKREHREGTVESVALVFEKYLSK